METNELTLESLLHLSFSRTLGTPNNDVWPDVESLPDYKNTFPKWKSGNLSSMVKNLDKNGLDLLAVRTKAAPQHAEQNSLLFSSYQREAGQTPAHLTCFLRLEVLW